MKIISWNIMWVSKYQLATATEEGEMVEKHKQNRIEFNKSKSKVVECIIKKEKADVVSLIESTTAIESLPSIDGYNRYVYRRKNKNFKNGIVVYIRNKYKVEEHDDIINELKNKNTECFIPLTLTDNDKKFRVVFVWTTPRRFGRNGEYESGYGLNRVKEAVVDTSSFKEFINDKTTPVCLMGDFNIRTEKKSQMNPLINMLKKYDLRFIETPDSVKTSKFGTNDHCFVNETAKSLFEFDLDVGRNSSRLSSNQFFVEWLGVKSDHDYLELEVNPKLY